LSYVTIGNRDLGRRWRMIIRMIDEYDRLSMFHDCSMRNKPALLR